MYYYITLCESHIQHFPFYEKWLNTKIIGTLHKVYDTCMSHGDLVLPLWKVFWYGKYLVNLAVIQLALQQYIVSDYQDQWDKQSSK
jgi:hypothetical protein